MDAIRPWLYIGKYRETRQPAWLQEEKITAMLLLAELVEHDGITSCYLAVEDGEPLPEVMLTSGIDFIRHHHQLGETILVACGAGISRSAIYAIAALKEIEGLSLWAAFCVVKQAHHESLPHFALWNSLCNYYGETVPWTDILAFKVKPLNS